MKKSKQKDSVFAKLQNKLSSKNKTPWYRQGKFVGPLLAVVVLSAVVLGVINEKTNLFQGAIRPIGQAQFTELEFGYDYNFYTVMKGEAAVKLYPYTSHPDYPISRFDKFELSYIRPANDPDENRLNFAELVSINSESGVITITPKDTIKPTRYFGEVVATLNGQTKKTRFGVRYVNTFANLAYQNPKVVYKGSEQSRSLSGYSNQLVTESTRELEYRLMDRSNIYLGAVERNGIYTDTMNVDLNTGAISGGNTGVFGINPVSPLFTGNYNSGDVLPPTKDLAFRGRMALRGCSTTVPNCTLAMEPSNTDSYALLDMTLYNSADLGEVTLLLNDEGEEGKNVTVSGVAYSQAGVTEVTYDQGCGKPTSGAGLTDVRYMTEPIRDMSIFLNPVARSTQYMLFKKTFNQLYSCNADEVNILRFNSTDQDGRKYSSVVRVDARTTRTDDPGGYATGSEDSIIAGLNALSQCDPNNLDPDLEQLAYNLAKELKESTQINQDSKAFLGLLLVAAADNCGIDLQDDVRTDDPGGSAVKTGTDDPGGYALGSKESIQGGLAGIASCSLTNLEQSAANLRSEIENSTQITNQERTTYLTLLESVVAGCSAVDAKITGLNVFPTNNVVLVGNTLKLRSEVFIVGTPAPQYELEWKSNNSNVATVDNTGLVTAVAPGETTVFVRVKGSVEFGETVKVTVVEKRDEDVIRVRLDQIAPQIFVDKDTETTNQSTYAVKAQITDNVGVKAVKMTVNGSLVQIPTLVNNLLQTNVTLREGENKIAITAYDAAGNMAVKNLTITYKPQAQPPAGTDTTDPVVTITSAATTTSLNYVVTGQVVDQSVIELATVSVNGSNEKALTLDSEGRFAKNIVLREGVNVLKVTAADVAGNEGLAVKSVIASPGGTPEDDFEVSISFDAGVDRPVDPLRPQLTGTVPFDKVVVNLYSAGTNEKIYTVYQHCLTGKAGCSYYTTSQYTTPIRDLDITNWAHANLADGLYYYKAYASRGDVADDDYSALFKYVNAGNQFPPNLPYQPCDYYFTDVPAGIPACEAVALVRELGIFYGNVDQYGQRVFRPNDPLLRTELFAIANRFARLPEVSYNPTVDGNMGFKDLDQFVNNPEAYWFMSEIKRMRRFGNSIIQGYNDGTLRPLVPILVAENAKVILEAGFTSNIIAAQRPAINLQKAPWWKDYEDFLASRGVYFGQPGGEVITRSEVAQFFADLYLRGLLR